MKTQPMLKGFKITFGWWLFNAFLRILFGLYNIFVTSMLDTPAPKNVIDFIILMFLFLGIMGFVSAIGWGLKKNWGIWGTICICVITICFDLWGMTIQNTAMAGFFVPALAIFHFTLNRQEYFGKSY